MTATLYKRVRSKKYLFDKAWPVVRRSGEKSKSLETQHAVKSFQTNAERHLKRIQRQLLKNRFDFGTARGVPIPKSSGGYRPLVVAEIPARIVQRSILEVLKTQAPIKDVIDQAGSYGTSRKRRVRVAIRDVCVAIDAGASYYVRSDIKEFFTKIPRLKVLKQLRDLLPDDTLDDLLAQATHFELEDLPPRYKELFPSYDEGVAQGCCLSPLFGNLLLREFDHTMNSGQVRTLRYVDDFIILGPDWEAVEAAFAMAQEILSGFEMQAYDPEQHPSKASCGSTSRKFDFLGCSISPGFIQPSKKARASFFSKIKKELRNAGTQVRKGAFDDCNSYDRSLLTTFTRISRMIRAWTNHYEFCNAQQTFAHLDRQVDKLIAEYIGKYASRRRQLDVDNGRRLLGVWLAQDGNRSPILH